MPSAAALLAAAGFVPAPRTEHVVWGTPPPYNGEQVGAWTNGDTVYADPSADKWVLGHESGHLFDTQVLNNYQRNRFERIMHAPPGPWASSDGTVQSGYKSPHEWFADYYAAAATNYNPRKEFHESYTTILPKRLDRFEALLARIGRKQGLARYVTPRP